MKGNTTLDANVETYRLFHDSAKEFEELDAIPTTFKCSLKENPELFAQKNAFWHKFCCVKFYEGKLSRAKKRREREQDPENEQRENQSKKKSTAYCCLHLWQEKFR
eukprot:Seg5518.3 transcript_id=Seg5518.3/GoldUCD/mRNA.D3Y31 product="hypothetical protein" protein_id=Seg5518.3/GoldUCD/D3Y31